MEQRKIVPKPGYEMKEVKKEFVKPDAAAWWNKTRAGEDFLSVKIDGKTLNLFQNKHKREGSKDPDLTGSWFVAKANPPR